MPAKDRPLIRIMPVYQQTQQLINAALLKHREFVIETPNFKHDSSSAGLGRPAPCHPFLAELVCICIGVENRMQPC